MPRHVLVATPYVRPFEEEFVRSFIEMKPGPGIQWATVAGMSVDVARNQLVHYFLKETDAEWLLWVDSDAAWNPWSLEKLLSWGVNAVAGTMYARNLPPYPTPAHYLGQDQDGGHLYSFKRVAEAILAYAKDKTLSSEMPNTPVEMNKDSSHLMEIDGCGCHFFLIRRRALALVQPPYFVKGPDGTGEDFYFCRKLKEAGETIWLDLSVQTAHIIGPGNTVGIREFLKFAQEGWGAFGPMSWRIPGLG